MIDPTQPFGYTVKNLAQNPANKSDAPFGQHISALAKEKNAARSAATDSLSNFDSADTASKNSLLLLNKTVLQALNKKLEADLGGNAIQNAYSEGLDLTPQATADRIVQAATSLFNRFTEKYADLNSNERLDSFLTTLRSGIEKGFAEARNILSGLNVLEGNIASNIDETFSLVQQGLDNFRASVEQINKS